MEIYEIRWKSAWKPKSLIKMLCGANEGCFIDSLSVDTKHYID